MEESKGAKKTLQPQHLASQSMDRLAQRWCEKISELHISRLKRLGLCNNMCLSLQDGVKLAKRLERIKTKYDYRISEILFKANYRTEVRNQH